MSDENESLLALLDWASLDDSPCLFCTYSGWWTYPPPQAVPTVVDLSSDSDSESDSEEEVGDFIEMDDDTSSDTEEEEDTEEDEEEDDTVQTPVVAALARGHRIMSRLRDWNKDPLI